MILNRTNGERDQAVIKLRKDEDKFQEAVKEKQKMKKVFDRDIKSLTRHTGSCGKSAANKYRQLITQTNCH